MVTAYTPAQVQAAEIRLRIIAHDLQRVLWQLDSARSELRKAQPTTGYRSTEKLGDAGWDIEAAQAKVTAAETLLGDAYHLLELGVL